MKWRKQFSLRDLIWLILLCAVSLSWWMDHRRLREDAESRPQLIKKNRELKVTVDLVKIEYEKQHRELMNVRTQLDLARRQ